MVAWSRTMIFARSPPGTASVVALARIVAYRAIAETSNANSVEDNDEIRRAWCRRPLGRDLCPRLPGEVVALTREQADLTRPEMLRPTLELAPGPTW